MLIDMPGHLWTCVAEYLPLRVCCDLALHHPYLNWAFLPVMARRTRRLTLDHACRLGHVGVFRWLADHLGLSAKNVREQNKHALVWAAEYGHLDLFQMLVLHFKFTPTPRLLSNAAANGRLQMCQWLAEHVVPLPDAHVDGKWALICAVQNGHLAVCQWLAAHFGLTVADVRADNIALKCAAQSGHLAVCQWLAAHFGLVADDAREDNNHALRWAAMNGHLAVCQWLAAHFGLVAADARAYNNQALLWAASAGHLAVCRWLVEWFGLTVQDARTNHNEALQRAASGGHLDVCQWLGERFGLTAAGARAATEQRAVCRGYLGACRRLVQLLTNWALRYPLWLLGCVPVAGRRRTRVIEVIA
jgi:hypothetical protein